MLDGLQQGAGAAGDDQGRLLHLQLRLDGGAGGLHVKGVDRHHPADADGMRQGLQVDGYGGIPADGQAVGLDCSDGPSCR